MNNTNKPKTFFVVSKFNEDISWLKDYVDENYLIFKKGEPIKDDYHVMNVQNQLISVHQKSPFLATNSRIASVQIV